MNLSLEEEAIRVDVFWEELESYSIEQVEEAFQWARGSLGFFPKPIEITKHINEEAYLKYQTNHKPEQIEWMEPTEKGKELALKMFSELKDKWNKEDREVKKKRDQLFEQRKKKLKKQAKFLK